MNMQLVSALILMISGLVFFSWGARDLYRYFEHRDLATAGTVAPARVLSMRETGRTVNGRPEVTVQVEVLPGGGRPFRAELTAVVSQVGLAAMASPGAVVKVRFDARDHSRIVLD